MPSEVFQPLKETTMNRKVIAAVMAVAVAGASAWSIAAERDKPAAQGMQGMQEMMSGCPMMGGGGMMGGGMMGGSGMPRGGMMPQLPPGNEKLQMQMHAEMMQRMGEILAKYASQVK
jgi:hypothetical protein